MHVHTKSEVLVLLVIGNALGDATLDLVGNSPLCSMFIMQFDSDVHFTILDNNIFTVSAAGDYINAKFDC